MTDFAQADSEIFSQKQALLIKILVAVFNNNNNNNNNNNTTNRYFEH